MLESKLIYSPYCIITIEKNGQLSDLGVWEMTFVIAGPIFVICVCVLMVFFYLWQRKYSGKKLVYHPDQANPLIEKYPTYEGGVETDPSGRVHAIIGEMTGSGSGGGMCQ
jgi:hypothetical protein